MSQAEPDDAPIIRLTEIPPLPRPYRPAGVEALRYLGSTVLALVGWSSITPTYG